MSAPFHSYLYGCEAAEWVTIMNKDTFEGIFPYLVSPIDRDGNVMEEPLRNLVSHLINCGVHGLTPLGSTGEFFYLSWEQKKKIVEIVVDETRHRIPVVAGVAASNTREAVFQAQTFERMGVEGILSILNVYFPLRPQDVRDYFSGVAQSVSCPIVLYNNPKFSHFEMGADLLESLCGLPNIQYYKDATGNTGNLLALANRLGPKVKIFSASAHVPVFVMMLGGVGWMSGPACVIPRESVKLYSLCKEKQWDEAMALQKKLWAINRIFQKYNLAACIKACLEMQGFAVGAPVPPNGEIDGAGKEEISQALHDLLL